MHRNGVDLDEVKEFTAVLASDPRAAHVALASRHHWRSGYALDWQAGEITVAGRTTARDHRLRVDLPEEVTGTDAGPAPGELLQAALGACIAGQFVGAAAMSGIDIEELEVTCDSEVDVRGAFGMDGVLPGLTGATVTVRVRADAEDAVLEELLRTAVATSPIADTLTRPIPVRAAVQAGGRHGAGE